MRTHQVIFVLAALLIGVGAKQYLFPQIKASQVTVAQNSLGVAIASPDKGRADRTEIVSVKTPVRPVSGTDGVERVDDQPLMATGLDLNGPSKRFSAKEILENLEVPGF
jgi:hypothetical protein